MTSGRRIAWLMIMALLAPLIGPASPSALAWGATDEATPGVAVADELADPDGAFIEIDGARLYYVARGPADGPAVILLHGLLGSTLTWTPVMEALADEGYWVVAFDQPPFGLSDKSPSLDLSVAAQAERAIGLMDALGIERAAVVGHSGGGPIAGTIAERYPDRVTALVLVAPAYLALMLTAATSDSASSVASPAASPAAPPAAGAPRPGRQVSFALFAILFDPANDPASAEDQAAIRAAVEVERAALPPVAAGVPDPFRFTRMPGWEAGLLAHGRAWLSDPAILGPDPAAITAPVLLIWGEGDGDAIREQLPALLPEATVVIVPGVGHFPMEEAPETFSRELLAFLGQQYTRAHAVGWRVDRLRLAKVPHDGPDAPGIVAARIASGSTRNSCGYLAPIVGEGDGCAGSGMANCRLNWTFPCGPGDRATAHHVRHSARETALTVDRYAGEAYWVC